MKKIIAIFLFIIYASSVFGIAINFHYCGNQLTKISVLNFGGHRSCDCNSQGIPMNCCRDKLCYHIGDNHNSTQPFTLTSEISFPIELPQFERNQFTYSLADNNKYIIYDYGDRRSNTQPIFILDSVFRI
jgi:hypothetical protein